MSPKIKTNRVMKIENMVIFLEDLTVRFNGKILTFEENRNVKARNLKERNFKAPSTVYFK